MSKITFGIVNYNRLHYLKSCAESLMQSIQEQKDVQLICIDDNSKESGTKEYLQTLADRGWTVINQEDTRKDKKFAVDHYQDTAHMNPFSDALNLLLDMAEGEYFVPLQGDMQFVKKNWVDSYVELMEECDNVGNICLDAQRKVRLEATYFTDHFEADNNIFAIDRGRQIGGAGDAFFRTSTLKELGGWTYGSWGTPETHFIEKINEQYGGLMKPYMPWNPPAAVIITGKDGRNARIRGGKRYGEYWAAPSDHMYYKWAEDLPIDMSRVRPQSIEELVVPNGDWELPLDAQGNMLKVLHKDIDQEKFEVIE